MILTVEQLRYDVPAGRTIFSDVSFQVAAGEILSILGPNGAGKSTLLNCIAGLLRPASGQICLEGQPMETLSLSRMAQILGYVPQTHHPAYDYLVRDFVVMGRAPYTHMPDHVILLGSRVGMLDYTGRMQFGSAEDVLTEQRLSSVYQTPLKVRRLEELGRNVCLPPNLDET